MVGARSTDLTARSLKRLILSFVAMAVCTAAILLGPSLVGAASAQAQVIGLGGAFFFDEGDMTGERKISVATEDIDYEYGNDTFISGSIWALFDIGDNVRMGPAFKYFGSYDIIIEDADDEEEKDELGILMEALIQVEWLLDMTDDFDLILGAQTGLVVLFPSGQLEDDIESLQDQGVDVFSTPRLGYVIGPTFGLRWSINDMFAVRGDFGIRWQQIFLFLTDQTVGSTPFSIEQHTNILRYEVALGLEVAF